MATSPGRVPPPTEHDEQCALIDRAQWYERLLPELRMLHAVPNGGLRPYSERRTADGRTVRYSPVAKRLRDEGVKKGVPDLDLPVARGGYHGLRIEMKRRGEQPTPEQTLWIGWLRAEGYRVEVCWSCDAAWVVLMEYLGRPELADGKGEPLWTR